MQVLIIPDLYESPTHWDRVLHHLTNAGVFATIVEYKPPRDEDVSEIVEDIQHHLVDETVVVGFGIGGRIAIQLAAQEPHQLAGVLLMSTPAMKAPGVRSFLKRTLMFVTTPLRILVPYYFRKKLENVYLRYYPGDPKKILYRRITADDQDAFLGKISDPLYLLWGSEDDVVRPAVASVISETLDYADVPHQTQIVAGGSRALHQTQPDLVAQTVLSIAQIT
jgi:pimeloyl-ACP methyl ester carboxylesterase